MTPALPCFKCDKVLENVWDDAPNQPHDATTFQTQGHYGSTVWDPMNGSALEINLCDECLRENIRAVYVVRPTPRKEPTHTYAPWDPKFEGEYY